MKFVACALLGGVLLSGVSGCSFIFVKQPQTAEVGEISTVEPRHCTSSRVAPVLDTVFGGLEGVRTVIAATADDSVYQNPDQPLSRGADVALGVGFAALFLSSAIYGYVMTASCDKANAEQERSLSRKGAARDAPVTPPVPAGSELAP